VEAEGQCRSRPRQPRRHLEAGASSTTQSQARSNRSVDQAPVRRRGSLAPLQRREALLEALAILFRGSATTPIDGPMALDLVFTR